MPSIQRQYITEFDTANQTAEAIHKAIDRILQLAGCGQCGRVAKLIIPVGDPEITKGLKELGVQAIREEFVSIATPGEITTNPVAATVGQQQIAE